MEGIRVLQSKGVNFSAIIVLTRFSLDYPDEMFRFLVDNGVECIAFNIDELEGIHTSSSFDELDSIEAYRSFIRAFIELTDGTRGRLSVREFGQLLPLILHPDEETGHLINSTNTALEVLTFDCRGNYSTFCPELSGTASATHQNFVMGNILADPIETILENLVFRAVNEEVQAGVRACKEPVLTGPCAAVGHLRTNILSTAASMSLKPSPVAFRNRHWSMLF